MKIKNDFNLRKFLKEGKLKEEDNQYYRLMADGEEHTGGLSWEEAQGMVDEYEADFPGTEYHIEPDVHAQYNTGEPKPERHIPRGAADGWEDLYEGHFGGDIEDRNEKLYDELVPGSGASETVEGEILRAVNRIAYRYFNDGDIFSKGYGTETAGSAHAFLVDADHPLKQKMSSLFSNVDQSISESEYETVLERMVGLAVSYIEGLNGNYTKNNLGEIFDYPAKFQDDEDIGDDYDDDDRGFDWGDDEDDEDYPGKEY